MEDPLQARETLARLKQVFPDYKANFDLEDCDRILRIAANSVISPEEIVSFLKAENVYSEVLQ